MSTSRQQFRLHVASRRGDVGKIRQYLAAGDAINRLNEKGQTPLVVVCAIYANRPSSVDVLLDAGAKHCIPDQNGYLLMQIVVERNDLAIAKLLIAAGADMNAFLCDKGIGTPLDIACAEDYKEMVQLLVDSGCDVEKRLPDGVQPLSLAALRGNQDIVKILVAGGANVNAVGKSNVTPLQSGCCSGCCNVVTTLIENGARINQVDEGGLSSLHNACGKGAHKIVDILIAAGADVNIKCIFSRTPLQYAARNGHHKCVWKLLRAGADVSIVEADGCSALHSAARDGSLRVIKLLLAARIDVNLLEEEGRTALVLACLRGHTEAVNLLIDEGCDPNDVDKYGRNALFAPRDLPTIQLLIEKGTSATALEMNKGTVLHHAGARGLDAGCICALYKKGGCDPTLKDKHGKTAADEAREHGHEDAAKMLDLLAAKHRALTQPTVGSTSVAAAASIRK